MKTPARLRRKAGAGTTGTQLTLLPEPPFCPTWPHLGTQASRCLDRLMQGHAMTHPGWEAVSLSWRLAAVVCELRDLGWPIDSEEISAPTPECPDRTIARYRLPQNIIALALAIRGKRNA
jgi:hypothetical protein